MEQAVGGIERREGPHWSGRDATDFTGGQPAGSGVDFNFSFGALGSPELSEAYDLVGDEGSMPTHPIKEPAAAARSEGIWALVVRDGLVWWRRSD